MFETKEHYEIEIIELGLINVKKVTKVFNDDVLIHTAYHRYGLVPGQDLTDQPDQVQAVANVVWTP